MARVSDKAEALSAKNGDLITLNSWASKEFLGKAAEIFLTSEDFSLVSEKQSETRFLSNPVFNHLAANGAALPRFVIRGVQFSFAEYDSLLENIGNTFDIAVLGKVPMQVQVIGYLFEPYATNSKAIFVEMYTHLLSVTSSSRLGIVPVLIAGNAAFEGAFSRLSISKSGTTNQDGSQIEMTMVLYKLAWDSPDNLSGATHAGIDYVVDAIDGVATQWFTTAEPTMQITAQLSTTTVVNTNSSGSGTSGGSGASTTDPGPTSDGLGGMSAHFESGSRGSNAIGYDVNSGTNYGKYQISSKKGTMTEFLAWAEKNGGANGKEVAERMRAAGALNTGGKSGDAPAVWQQLAKEGKLGTMEHDYIKATHYDVAYRRISSPELRAKIDSSPALQDALWSTAVQHGPYTKVVNQAYKPGMSEAQFAEALYTLRGGNFNSSTPEMRALVKNRFVLENAKVQQRLLNEAAQNSNS